MQVSYFETARYRVPPTVPAEWPVPPGAYDPDIGTEAYQGMVDLAFQNPGAADTGRLMHSLELFADKVLPRIREV
jgi:hypothetical protein